MIVAGAILVAAVLSSLAPPSKALAAVGGASAHVGPGPVTESVVKNGYKLDIRVSPNRAAVPNSFSVHVTRNNRPVRGADVVMRFTMLDMEMGQQEYRLTETSPGTYTHAAPALVMVGHWGSGSTSRRPGARRSTSSSWTRRTDEPERLASCSRSSRSAAARRRSWSRPSS